MCEVGNTVLKSKDVMWKARTYPPH